MWLGTTKKKKKEVSIRLLCAPNRFSNQQTSLQIVPTKTENPLYYNRSEGNISINKENMCSETKNSHNGNFSHFGKRHNFKIKIKQ